MVVDRYAQTGDFAILYHVLGRPVMPLLQGLPGANGPKKGIATALSGGSAESPNKD
jgi:hypothetical protein